MRQTKDNPPFPQPPPPKHTHTQQQKSAILINPPQASTRLACPPPGSCSHPCHPSIRRLDRRHAAGGLPLRPCRCCCCCRCHHPSPRPSQSRGQELEPASAAGRAQRKRALRPLPFEMCSIRYSIQYTVYRGEKRKKGVMTGKRNIYYTVYRDERKKEGL